jgi:hypothetical protein
LRYTYRKPRFASWLKIPAGSVVIGLASRNLDYRIFLDHAIDMTNFELLKRIFVNWISCIGHFKVEIWNEDFTFHICLKLQCHNDCENKRIRLKLFQIIVQHRFVIILQDYMAIHCDVY